MRIKAQEFLANYQAIKKVICLEQNYRQTVDGQANAEYMEFLGRLRRGTVVQDDFKMVKSRMRSEMTEAEKEKFKNVVWAFPMNVQVDERNRQATLPCKLLIKIIE